MLCIVLVERAGFNGICGAATYSWAYTGGYRINTVLGTGGDASWDETSPANSLLSAEEFFVRSQSHMPSGSSQTMCYYTPSVYRTIFTTDYELGDINKDWYIGTPDVLALRNHISESQILTGRATTLADLNQDGAVNLQDLLALRQFIADM